MPLTLEDRLQEFVEIRPTYSENYQGEEGQTPELFVVSLKIGVQSFYITPGPCTAEEADFFRRMLLVALKNMVGQLQTEDREIHS